MALETENLTFSAYKVMFLHVTTMDKSLEVSAVFFFFFHNSFSSDLLRNGHLGLEKPWFSVTSQKFRNPAVCCIFSDLHFLGMMM